VLLNVLVSVFLGTLLGVGLALMLELANRKVRSADDLAEALDLPVLGAIASAGRALKRSGGYKPNGPAALSGARA
jgi:capsular polysaccharide biosynthesis protein